MTAPAPKTLESIIAEMRGASAAALRLSVELRAEVTMSAMARAEARRVERWADDLAAVAQSSDGGAVMSHA